MDRASRRRRTALVTGSHAVVIGAGIAGLCAAQVLADVYDRVTLADRDLLPPGDAARAGAPQGRHNHAVLVSGNRALRELFPGLVEEFIADGVPTGDILAHARPCLGPDRLKPAPSGLEGIYIGRPELERRLRERLTQRPNVAVVAERIVVGLAVSPDATSVIGVRTTTAGSPAEEILGADLVIDASGRNSRMPQWLSDVGYTPPPEQRLRIDVGYSSRTFSMPEDVIDHDHGVLAAPAPGHPRGAGLIDMGSDRWLVSLMGYGTTAPPVELEAFIEFARSLAVPDIYEALLRATPVGAPARYRMPEAVRRRYDKLSRFPDRLVVLGDAVCVFNPIYAQGMSVAARQAVILRQHLQENGPHGFTRLRRRIAHAAATAWTMSVTYDLRMPWIPGRRSPVVRLGNLYIGLLSKAAATDATVARAFLRVANLLEGPAHLARPAIVGRVLIGAARPRRPGRRATSTAGRRGPR